MAIVFVSAQPAVARQEDIAHQSTCQPKAKRAQVGANQAPEAIVGAVESVQGSTLMLRLDDQKLRQVVVPDAQGVDLRFLVGQRVVIQQQMCYLPPQPPIPQGG